LLLFGSALAGTSETTADRVPETARLGKVHFANSCSPGVQAEFDNALALLHSFQYGLAETTFAHVAQEDPQCAIAYWGAAMTLYHQLWDWPNAETLRRGHKYLEKARPLRKKSEREKAYLTTAAAFYQPEHSLGRTSRVQAYFEAMRDLHKRYPQDNDAAALYALSLLTLPSQGDDSLANERKAIVVLRQLFSAQPEHPGAAHYLIHATDAPKLARLGLPAALRYAQISPASPHALHMPSHIFVRLGMWQDSIASNLSSLAAAEDATTSQRDDGSGDALHAMMYLFYSYLQSGQDEEARLVVERISTVPGATVDDIANNLSILEALHAVETQQWKQASTLPVRPSAFPYARVRTFWARAIGAARSGDISSARENIERLDEARAGMLAYMRSVDVHMHMGHNANSDICVQQLEAQAWLAWAEGKTAEALETMRAAARKEESYGVESRTVPADEMLGDLLLELHQPAVALDAYERALKEAPARFNALTGAARASRAMGDSRKARFYYATLMRCCSPVARRKELDEARVFISGD
jgi:tetratricopeptide (TPR) repeat protein